jgi:hypothetical protein
MPMPGLPIPKIFAPALRADKIHLFDVGAAGGLQGRWRQMLPYLEAFLFEPDERSYEKMVARADGINYLNYALGGKAGSVELHLLNGRALTRIFLVLAREHDLIFPGGLKRMTGRNPLPAPLLRPWSVARVRRSQV